MSELADVGGAEPAELVARRRGRSRRQWTLAEKLSIVKEISETGDPVAEVARRHGMNANQLFSWRQLARSGALADSGPAVRMDFVEVGVVGPPAPMADAGEKIEVALPSGIVVRVPASATGRPLRAALTSIRAAGL